MIDDDAVAELVHGVLARLRSDLGAAACSVALAEGEELVFVAASGAGAEEVLGLRLPVGRGIAGWCYVSGETVAVADVAADRRWDRTTAEQTGYLPRSILATPVDDGDATLGVVEVLDRSITERDQGFGAAAAAARQLALVVRLWRAGGAHGAAAGRWDGGRSVSGLPPTWRGRLDRLADASPGEQRLAARVLDALIDPEA